MKIRKAVIPVAGFGTRFLPQTKAMPKEMFPVVDKPVVQYVVEELVEAGIEQIILVTGWHKRAIEDHFDRHFELEAKLEKAGKEKELAEVRRLSELAQFIYVRQKETRGNGDAVLAAESVVGDEPFIVCWGDEIIGGTPSRAEQLLDAYDKYQATIVPAFKVDHDPDAPKKYGYVGGEMVDKDVMKVNKIVEKPGIGNTPSPYAAISGAVFTQDIFPALKEAAEKLQEGQELVYVDGINVLLNQGKSVYAKEIVGGKHYDCGTKLSYLKTVVEIALQHKEFNGKFAEYLKNLQLE